MADLQVFVRERDPRRDAAREFAFRTIGLATTTNVGSPPDGFGGPHLVDGAAEPRPDRVVIPARAGDIFWTDLLEGRFDPATSDGSLPFDVLGAIAGFLEDGVDAESGSTPGALDEHGRLRWSASAAAGAGFGDRAIVNQYVACRARRRASHLGVVGRPRWPDGHRAAIGLSHDVDLPDRYALLESAWRPWRFRRAPRTYAQRSVELVRRRRHDPDRRDFWLFDRVARSEADHGFRSTFFFATVPFHGRYGAAPDIAYDVRGRRYRSAIRSLLDGGFGVGLHASYRAFEDPTRFADEKRTLEDAAGVEVRGLRHHYWHLGPDPAATLRAHEAAGFAWDTSIAFNDHVGFRRGVAQPWHPWDDTLGRPLRTLQLPTFCMDGNLFYGSDDVEAAVTAVDRAVDEIVATGGMGSIDWHIQTSHPSNDDFRPWGVAYQAILERLAARPEVWTTDLDTIERWVTERDGRLARASSGADPTAETDPLATRPAAPA